ncbi:hypothetical protein [Paractinoplanes maris]|uniref:hypothetical protein n=1 Tax=Paractinoplanes maris TaxID=1734446 RepID=UPI0020201DD0|nr:hypothetical protein [Actinoplanes maris]
MRRSHVLLATTIALTVLPGCGSPAKEGAKVATLASAAASPSAKAKPDRPRERLDTTPEEFEALLTAYYKCMDDKGVLAVRVATGGRKKAMTPEDIAQGEAADRICEPLHYPLPPWEKDPANPEAVDFTRAVVKCLKGKGIKNATVGDDGVSVSLGSDDQNLPVVRKFLDLTPDCEREAAAAK